METDYFKLATIITVLYNQCLIDERRKYGHPITDWLYTFLEQEK